MHLWRRSLAVIAVGLALSLAAAALLVGTTDFFSCGDCPRYVDIAQQPFIFTASPWGYRIFVPYLARALSSLTPLSLDQAFLVLTLVAFSAIVTTIIYWFSEVLRQPLFTAILLALLYVFSFGAVFYLHGYQNIGFWEHLAILLGLLAIYHHRFGWLVVAVLVGQLVKESSIVLIPLYLIYALAFGRRRTAIVNTTILSVAYLAVFFFLRSGVLWKTGGNVQDYASYYTPAYFEWLFSVYGGPLRAIPKTLAILPVTLPLAVLGFGCANRKVRALAMLAPLTVTQLLFGGDVERLMSLAVIGMLLPIASLFRRMSVREQVSMVGLTAAAFYVHYYLVFSPRFYDPVTWTNPYLYLIRFVVAGCYAIVLGWYFLVFRRRQASPAIEPATASAAVR